ncbi:MAG: PEP-CTERM sorting domain-containing protein [Pseudomonadota bacterium]
MRLPLLASLLLTASLGITPSMAAPIDFTETSDIGGAGTLSLGALGVGVNTASGSLIEFDADSFTFTLLDGLQVDSLELFVSDHRDSRVSGTSVSYRFDDSIIGSLPDNGSLGLLSDPLALAGEYRLRVAHEGGIPNAFSNWRWNITVSQAVPEPSTVALFGLGGLLLAGRRRQAGLRPRPPTYA